MSRLGTAIACYCRHAPGEGVEHVFPVPHIPEAVSAVRRRVRHVLDGWELTGEAADTTLLVVSELVTNAIVHALPPATLRLCWTRLDGHRTLRVEVSDGGPAAPAPSPADADAFPEEHGRGIGIVTAVSARNGVRTGEAAVTRWADLHPA